MDNIDHLANRRVRRVGELVTTAAFRPGLLRLERSIKEKMSLVSTEESVPPTQLINARPVIAAVNEFFRSNRLSTVLDQTNPLSEIDNLRRLRSWGQAELVGKEPPFRLEILTLVNTDEFVQFALPRGPILVW